MREPENEGHSQQGGDGLLAAFSFRSMVLIDVFLIAISLFVGFWLPVKAIRFHLVPGFFFLHALLSLAAYIHHKVKESARFLNILMLICFISTAANLIALYLRIHG